ncbi:hypothetical protein DNTS_026109, partial [Danionella cerebrum]
MYRDELDAVKERAIRADKLEGEVARYREKLHNMNFYKVKLEELNEDNQVLMESKMLLEEELQSIKSRSDKLQHLEKHNLQLEAKLHDMEEEKIADRKQLEELLERTVMLELSYQRSLEESQRLGWELDLARNPQQNSGTELKSLNQEVTEKACSRILKLEKENQSLLKALEDYKAHSPALNECIPNSKRSDENGRIDYLEWTTAVANIHNSQLIKPTQETQNQSLHSEHLDAPMKKLNEPKNQVDVNQDQKQTEDQSHMEHHKRSLEKENQRLREQVKTSLDSNMICGVLAETTLPNFTESQDKLLQQDGEDKRMLVTLQEELLDQRMKLQQKECDLEKCVYELERMRLSQETRMGDHEALKQNFEALLQKTETEKHEPCSSTERVWHRENPEATWVLLKVKDQLVEVERNVEKSTVSSQNSSLMVHNTQLQRERQSSEVEREGAIREREDLRTVNELLLRDHERLSGLHERQAAELELLSHRYSTMESSHRTLEIEHRSLEDKYNTLLQQCAQMEGLEKALREDQQKMQNEICTSRNATAECQRLRDEKDWVNQSYQKLLAENEGLRAEQKNMKCQLKTLKLEQVQLRSELFELEEQDQQLEMVIFKLTNRCELLTQLKGNLEEENRHLLDQIQSVMQQNQSLLDQTMENKDLFHMEQRQYIDKLNELRRQKEKLEEKIMDQYKFYEPSPPRRRGNWIMLKLRKLMKTRAREQEQIPSSDPQLNSGSSEGLDELKCHDNASFMSTLGSEESTSNSFNGDTQSPKSSSRKYPPSSMKWSEGHHVCQETIETGGKPILPKYKTEKKCSARSPSWIRKAKYRCNSLRKAPLLIRKLRKACSPIMIDLQLSEGCVDGISSQPEDQPEEQLTEKANLISQIHSTSSCHHCSPVNIPSIVNNEASLIGKSSRAPSASSGEFSVSLENEAWSSDSSPLPDTSLPHLQQFNDSPSTQTNHDEPKQGCFRIGVQRTSSDRSTGEDHSPSKLDKVSVRLCKTQSMHSTESDSKPAADTQAKSSSVSGCLNCFATSMRSPKKGQAASTLPRASWVISTSEGNSRRASVLSNVSGKSVGSNSSKTCLDAQPDSGDGVSREGRVLEDDEHQPELLFDSEFTLD